MLLKLIKFRGFYQKTAFVAQKISAIFVGLLEKVTARCKKLAKQYIFLLERIINFGTSSSMGPGRLPCWKQVPDYDISFASTECILSKNYGPPMLALFSESLKNLKTILFSMMQQHQQDIEMQGVWRTLLLQEMVLQRFQCCSCFAKI